MPSCIRPRGAPEPDNVQTFPDAHGGGPAAFHAHTLLGLASTRPLPVPEHPYAGDEGGDKALAGVAEEGQEDPHSAGRLPGGPSSDPLSFRFLMNDTHDRVYDPTLAPVPPRKPFPASLLGLSPQPERTPHLHAGARLRP